MACANCGAGFVCGASAGASSCWCMAMPPLAGELDPAAGCYCPACLEEKLSAVPTAPAT